jgi:hypothetical protein
MKKRTMSLVAFIGAITLSGACVQPAGAAVPSSLKPAPAQHDASPGSTHRKIAGTPGPGGSVTFTTGDSGVVVQASNEPVPSADELTTLAASISCDMDVQNVHGSTHVSGTINEVVKVQCTGVAGHIRLATEMYRLSPTYAKWTAGTKNQDNTSWLQNNVATSCSAGPGEFRGWGWGTITPPPGYTLVGPADYSKYGNITSVACGMSFAASSEPSLASRTTITFVRTDLAESSRG